MYGKLPPKSKSMRQIEKALKDGLKKHAGENLTPELVVKISEDMRVERGPGYGLHDPSNCVEFVNEDGSRYAWSESNVQYAQVVDKEGEMASFHSLRLRERGLRIAAEQLLHEVKHNLKGEPLSGSVALAMLKLSQWAQPKDHGRGPGGA